MFKMVYLLFGRTLNTMKRYNANQHYVSHKDHKFVAFERTYNSALLVWKKRKISERWILERRIGK